MNNKDLSNKVLKLNEEQIKNLNEIKTNVIKTGLTGIFVFALAIGGAILSFYLGKTPEYTILRTVVILTSLIIFLIGLVILYFFKHYVDMYYLIRDYNEDEE